MRVESRPVSNAWATRIMLLGAFWLILLVPPVAAAARLLGDPGGLRSRLEGRGVVVRLSYQQLFAWTPSGGSGGDGRTGHSASYDLFAIADLERLTGAPGLELLLHAKGQYDRSLNADAGAVADPYDDADFDEGFYLDQLYFQQRAWNDRLWLRVGLVEHQTVFDRNAYANHEDRQFMNAFLDNDPVVPLPHALGAAVWVRPLHWLELAAGVSDADNGLRGPGFESFVDDAESLNLHVEAAFRVEIPSPRGSLPGTWRIGAFRDGAEKPVFGRVDRRTGAERRRRGHEGFYLSADQQVFREAGVGDQGLGLFLRYGHADDDVNRIARFASAGIQYTGAVPGRDADVLGLGAYHAVASDRFRAAGDSRFARETGIELYYRIELRRWLALTPDLQYIVDPGGTARRKDRVLAALRLRVSF